MAYFQQQSVIRCSAREQGMRWRWEGIAGRRFCYTPTHLHPLTIVQGIWPMRLVFVDCLVPVDSMSLVIQFDPEHVFDDADPNNENQFHRLIMGWKYTQPRQLRRSEAPNFLQVEYHGSGQTGPQRAQRPLRLPDYQQLPGLWLGQSTYMCLPSSEAAVAVEV